jgi:hypothetical protein
MGNCVITLPLLGVDIVGAVDGGGALIWPCKPRPSDCGFSTCANAIRLPAISNKTILRAIVVNLMAMVFLDIMSFLNMLFSYSLYSYA